MAKQPLEMRRDRVRRSNAHRDAQQPALAAARQLERDVAAFAAKEPGEKADITRRRSLAQKAAQQQAQRRRQADADRQARRFGRKRDAQPIANKALAPNLEDKSKAELAKLAQKRGIAVVRTDGRTDVEPTKGDYLAALGA